MINHQLGQAGTRSIPLTLLILLLVFGSLLAAWVPLMLGLQSVIATLGLVDLISHITPMSSNVQAVVMLVGLAVGVDYTLFYLQREREERAAGRSEHAALHAAAATSGRSVLISGATVLIAMAGMLFAGDPTFTSFSIATMIVVAVAMVGSLTVLPALLSKLGDRVEKGRIPLLGRFRRPAGENRVWSKILTPALRHTAIVATLAVTALIALAIPTLHMHTAWSGLQTLPRNAPTVQTLDRIQAAFPGQTSPAVIAQDRHQRPRVPGRTQRTANPCRGQRPGVRGDPGRHQRGAHRRADLDPTPGRRHRQHLDQRAADAPRPTAATDGRQGPRGHLRGHRDDSRLL